MSEQRPTGHITCSSLDRIAACPGSWNLEQQVPTNEAETNLEAQSGIRIHAALAREIGEEILTADERDIYDSCKALTHELLGGTFIGSTYSAEKRLHWIDDNGQTLLSGRFDAAWEGAERDLIIDYKTGRGDVPPAEKNWQMRGLAVLWDLERGGGPKAIEVAIIQPLGTPQVTRCRYSAAELEKAHDDLYELLEDAYQPEAPRRPSEAACKYCRAKAICPEAQGIVTSLGRIEGGENKLEVLRDEDLSELLEACRIAPKIIDAIKSEARKRIEAGRQFGWHLKPGVERESIKDIATVYSRLSTLDGITQGEFLRILKATKQDLKNLLREKTQTKGYALDLTLKQRLEGCTEVKTTEPSLERDE